MLAGRKDGKKQDIKKEERQQSKKLKEESKK